MHTAPDSCAFCFALWTARSFSLAGLLSGYDIREEQLRHVLWNPSGAYAAFLHKLPFTERNKTIPRRYKLLGRLPQAGGPSQPLSLKWVPLRALQRLHRHSTTSADLQNMPTDQEGLCRCWQFLGRARHC